jgi:hypothetical protein
MKETMIWKMMLCQLFVLLAMLQIDRSHAESPSRPLPSFRKWFALQPSETNTPVFGKKIKRKWSSMLSIDPTKILSTLIDAGGLLIPHSAESEIHALKKMLRVDKAELNVVEKRLILYNFTVGIKGEPDALRIGRVCVQWDSYINPCLDIEVSDIDIFVEFTNFILTRSNWNELCEAGLIPKSTGSAGSAHGGDSIPFLRFASIDLSGMINVSLASRPLDKELGAFSLDMIAADDLRALIRDASEDNKLHLSRRGCSSTELATILRDYFGQKVKSFLADSVYDIANDPGAAVRGVDEFLGKLSGTVLNYAGHAGRKTGENVENAVVTKLGDLGLSSPVDKFSVLKQRTMNTIFNKINAAARQNDQKQLTSGETNGNTTLGKNSDSTPPRPDA